ncbi:MAG: DHA2 family efflux MFS transporter permease subunit [Bacteroidales bacterium]|nr:DHA2 family efflux MFS transporter permease subunit [Bacteroidales bacterium]
MPKRRNSVTHRLRRYFRDRYTVIHPENQKYKWFLLMNVMIGTFMAVLDATIVNVGLPKIMASFGVGIDKIEWVLTAYMLALAVMLPTSGWLADKFGYKKVYFYGLFLFTFGSFLCGIASDENFLIMSRVVQGLGAGCLMPVGMAIITREFPPSQRGVALGFWSIAAAASVSFGPLIGGYLVDNFSWNLIFDVNIPIGIIGMLVTLIIQREYRNKSIRGFDVIGFLSVSLFLPFFLYALTEGNASGNSEGWGAPHILLFFGISIISLAVFITTELTIKNPLIDLKLLKDHNFAISNLIMLIFGIGMFGSTFLLPVYLQNSLGYTAIQAGSVFLPVGIIQGMMSPIAGRAADKINPKIPILLGITLLALSFYLNSFFSYLTEHWYIMMTLYMRGFAMGVMFTPLSAISLLDIPREKMAQASGLFNVIRQIGGSLGVAILATMLTSRVGYHVQTFGESMNRNSPELREVAARLAGRFVHSSGSSFMDAGVQAQSAIMSHLSKQAFIQGINDDFLFAAIISIIGVVPVFFLHTKKKKLKIQARKNNEMLARESAASNDLIE